MRTIQFVSLILSCWVAIAVSGQASAAGFNRFLVVPRTVTTTITSTTVVKSTTLTTDVCYTTEENAEPCARRRRNSILEKIEASAPVKMTATVAPEVKAFDAKSDSGASAGSEVQLASSIQSTDGFAEVIITDMESICKGRGASPAFGALAQAFGISVLTTTTVTASTTSTQFVPSVVQKIVTLACDPKAFVVLKACA